MADGAVGASGDAGVVGSEHAASVSAATASAAMVRFDMDDWARDIMKREAALSEARLVDAGVGIDGQFYAGFRGMSIICLT